MYRVTFTSLIAVSLLLVFVHSIREPRFGDNDERSPPNRVNTQSVTKINSPIRPVQSPLFKPRPFGINTGGAGGAGSVQIQQGDGGRSRTSGGNGGAGGFVRGTGIQNTGGAGGSGSAQIQLGANSQSETSGGNGASGGGVLQKRQVSLSSSFDNAASFPGQNIGGRGGDGSVQVQGGGPNSVSGGNGGPGGNVFGSQPSPQPSFPSGGSMTNIENSVSAEKRAFAMSGSFNDGPSFPGQNVGGRGGDGNVQVQGGESSSISGGNGGAGGSVFGSQSGFPSSQSMTNMQSSFSGNKRELVADKNVSRVD